ncbi:MAG: DUF3467 domain-containing protein [Candidatus Marinimicrobia bacterium]|nr:DUF3467 domain-containing protein [Candidatus Neomarinimicrobiota bacterium]
MTEKVEKKLEINLPENKSGGHYSNLAVITHSPSEFILDFCQMMPGTPKANVASRIIMNPLHAKALYKTLEANLKRFEQNFGEIKDISHPPVSNINPGKKLPN